jgi:hypothetical protein
MPKTPSPLAERQADDIIDAYLANQFGVGLERVLLDGIEGRVTAAIAGVVTIEAKQTGRWPYADGGLAEFYEGTLTLQGVAYSFRCDAYSMPDAYVHRFLTNVGHFEPVEWTACAQVSDGAQG